MHIKKEFEYAVLGLYNKIDIEKGFIITANRNGEIEKFPLITLTCVVINSALCKYDNTDDLTEELATLKKQAKQKLKSIS